MGIGSLSMIVPMYNAEIAPPEVRGALVGLQQLSITLGIMIFMLVVQQPILLPRLLLEMVKQPWGDLLLLKILVPLKQSILVLKWVFKVVIQHDFLFLK